MLRSSSDCSRRETPLVHQALLVLCVTVVAQETLKYDVCSLTEANDKYRYNNMTTCGLQIHRTQTYNAAVHKCFMSACCSSGMQRVGKKKKTRFSDVLYSGKKEKHLTGPGYTAVAHLPVLFLSCSALSSVSATYCM